MTKALALLVPLCGAAALLAAFSVQDTGTTTADFLALGSGARSEALGEAYVALAEGTDALSYNPAGIARGLDGELSASEGLWLGGLSYDELGLLVPDERGGAWGADFGYLAAPPIARTLLTGGDGAPYSYVQDGTFSPYDMLAGVDYAHPLWNGLLGGAGLKLVDQSLDAQGALGVAADLGLLWRSPVQGLDLGASLDNLGPPVRIATQSSPMPFIARGGAAYGLWDGALRLTAEGDLPADGPPVLATGAEFNIADRFFPRVGWRWDGQFNPWSLGFGLRYGDWGLDLSAVPYGPLGNTYRATLEWSFGGPGAQLRALSPCAGTLGGGQEAVLAPRMSAPAKVETWAVTIYDSARPARVVRTLSGFGPPAATVAWDGRDNAGAALPEGVYWAALSVRYPGGRSVHSPYVRLQVLDSAPRVDLAFDPSSVDPYDARQAYVPTAFHPRLLRGGEITRWRLELRDAGGRLFRTLAGAGAPPSILVWDGKGDDGEEFISATAYTARLIVDDAFGDEAAGPTLRFIAVFR